MINPKDASPLALMCSMAISVNFRRNPKKPRLSPATRPNHLRPTPSNLSARATDRNRSARRPDVRVNWRTTVRPGPGSLPRDRKATSGPDLVGTCTWFAKSRPYPDCHFTTIGLLLRGCKYEMYEIGNPAPALGLPGRNGAPRRQLTSPSTSAPRRRP